MKIVFANSAWVSAAERLILRGGSWQSVRLRVRYGLIFHAVAGPVLIDTGYTPEALSGERRGRMLRLYGALLKPQLNADEQVLPLLRRFGLSPSDIRNVVVTHFHADHISGLSLFRNARFIANDAAWARVKARTPRQNLRHGVFTELFPADFESRLDGLSGKPRIEPRGDMPGGTDIFGDGSVVAVDLPGHADGQFGLLFNGLERPLLYAVDVQWLLTALTEKRTPGFPATLIAEDAAAIEPTSAMLRRFLASGGEVMLCHDPAPTSRDLAPEAA
ncbi:MBL fold metallo-hydrolase [Mesorhizobium sp. M2D.F.Ca.ET.185.01.1.1]|uniref:MBL fold metallo-hydrolase n=1 Tax=unclassified Mesorhizobium TaxID=325217 RepID=UPI000FCA9F17|nr:MULTISPECIES: MBL fold metallo-hydrolase [unclassified Mesorhizobium]TGP76944.1 MBL fold metallo-hydrolase [bacterium M00.F.Ca.ET.227.01.1.1]TGP84927.1 MBL fold metallo-hydrolase [bacterium M00.F.Ca.ET.221.01.1.1]TGP88497.1 MBL fold metallo-hydrolase [bacterium M00.F.Ca.ET.222.01.1.1]TGU04701.1 MBL fold metallo-hydrolase [bacterium M00.F.Ca.ET.163.01.1.1]TGU30691.1 MBL fold metallo-hydrolase [bacterium M00.F.Ca.ET.156.01.1.1]TGU44948.1 MBL fold metallo-hydrolase [bacterium M00.F.Ca.ET.146.